MDAAHIIKRAAESPRTVRGQEAEQLRARHGGAVRGEQPGGAQPAAAVSPVAGQFQHGEAGRQLAHEDDGWHGHSPIRKGSLFPN